MERSLYIHVPFCRRKCVYCDFFSTVYDAAVADRYTEVIIKQINDLSGVFSTVYIGGGTPSALEPETLKRLLEPLRTRISTNTEFTVEANPESLDERRIRILYDHGVNRLSIGMQSLDDRKLKKLGRLHNAAKARDAVLLASRLGFRNIGIDLIFGVWAEDADDWKYEIEEALKLPVKHISAYSLSYEKGTPLFSALNNKSIKPVSDQDVARMYETAIEIFGLRGFKQYEISNFAAKGFASRHNINYWENGPYYGIGASAASYLGGVRAKNISDINEYIRRYESMSGLIGSKEKLSPLKRAKETAAIKIRTKDGIDFRWFRERTGYDFLDIERTAVDEMIGKGFIKFKREGDQRTGVALKRLGFLFCDTVSAALL